MLPTTLAPEPFTALLDWLDTRVQDPDFPDGRGICIQDLLEIAADTWCTYDLDEITPDQAVEILAANGIRYAPPWLLQPDGGRIAIGYLVNTFAARPIETVSAGGAR